MFKKDWRLFAQDILESIARIESYVADLAYEDFLADNKTQDAVVRNLEIIGEAARHIPQDVQSQHPGIPWAQLIGLRNRLIHGYFVVDYEIVWDIVKNELPGLKRKLAAILEELRGKTA
ncbi:MAG: Nucleotidyltransferase [Acetothermia bacterium 64_32]|nr:MAG: Nucleotidyltransferase [Acetothermia bacterium 64_32]HAF70682.1 hypothetical protein [Candidatus Acetothermia bacterium]